MSKIVKFKLLVQSYFPLILNHITNKVKIYLPQSTFINQYATIDQSTFSNQYATTVNNCP